MRDDLSKKEQRKKKNFSRLGGSGLSLHAFANAKSTSARYNPAVIKKKREIYKNAKYVSKFKKKFKQQTRPNDTSIAATTDVVVNEVAESNQVRRNGKKNKKKKNSCHLQKLYEKQREEREKARNEEEAILKAEKEEKEKAEARRKAAREKMFKKTQRGQPVMKYRIEHLLQTIQNSKSTIFS